MIETGSRVDERPRFARQGECVRSHVRWDGFQSWTGQSPVTIRAI